VTGKSDVTCKHCNEPSGSIKGEKFVENMSDYYLLRKDFAAWCNLNIYIT
jgi:hypothetical protein